jgi:UDP-N-acetylglucosamine kinase
MTQTNEEVLAQALAYAKSHRTRIARERTDLNKFPSEEQPVSVFMAGSPGAGKTEASMELLSEFDSILRIDPDDLRVEFPAYGGSNSWLFQGAVALLVERIHDRALAQGQSFLLDGTLSNYAVAEKNIERSLKRGRLVQILYVYQEPAFAWQFVRAREVHEGRYIPPEKFVDQYFLAREVVQKLKDKYDQQIRVDVLLKNTDGTTQRSFADVDNVDKLVPERFNREHVMAIANQN